MINYFEWPKRKISTTSLRLDIENPRLTNFGRKPTQPEIIDYLIENEKVFDLAKSIVSQGYFLNEQPIVHRENNKLIVLEGNRRVAACKILINPDLIKSSGKRSIIKKALKDFDLNIITKLEVIISPSREDADIMIVNRHTEGSVVEKWDKTKQDRFFYNRIKGGETIEELASKFSMTKGDMKKSLQRYNMFSEINKLELDDKVKKIIQEEVKFTMTNVERVHDSKYGRDFLGIEFDSRGEVIKKLPQQEFNKRLKKIVNEIIDGNINSRTLNREEEDKKPYFESLLKSKEFNTTIKQDSKYNNEYPTSKVEDKETETEALETGSTKRKEPSKEKLFANNLYFETGIKRLDDIFVEIKNLKLKNNSNAIAVLVRSYIDMVTYQFLNKKNGLPELMKLEGEKIKNENVKILESAKKYLQEIKISITKIDDEKFKKAIKLKGSVTKGFIPSLRFMLDYLAKSELITETKLKHSLQSYLNKDSKIDKIIGHNEFNLLVHNEYYTNDADELKLAWNKLEPILEYMINEIKKK